MAEYAALAGAYDALTQDVPYDAWVNAYEKLFVSGGRKRPEIVLDLGCGTGSVAVRLAERGYEVVAVDASPDMLWAASEKSHGLKDPPVWVCQRMESLDLYGTVDAAVSSLGSINYVTTQKMLMRAFERVALFLSPGGMFIFDVQSPSGLRSQGGTTVIKEADGVYCAFESRWSEKTCICTHDIELFLRAQDGRWERYSERHRERAYGADELSSMLADAGFANINILTPERLTKINGNEERWLFTAEKPV